MKKILVVDDEVDLLKVSSIRLRKTGYEVFGAVEGQEALDLARQKMPDLIVLDIMMPRKDGFQTLKELKSNPETAEIPIIMLTAKAQDGDMRWIDFDKGVGLGIAGSLAGNFKVIFTREDKVDALPEKDLRV